MARPLSSQLIASPRRTDNGTSSIALQGNAVHDAAGNALAAGTIGNISVNIGDIAGNTLKLAKNLKIAKASKISLSNFVGSSDHDAYFKVPLTAPMSMNLTLSDAGSFSRLKVLNSKD